MFNPNNEGPAIVAVGFGCGDTLSVAVRGCSDVCFAEVGVGPGEAVVAGLAVPRCDSSGVPHIPQKRKAGELSSPHFGQITIVSGPVFILQCNLAPLDCEPAAHIRIWNFGFHNGQNQKTQDQCARESLRRRA